MTITSRLVADNVSFWYKDSEENEHKWENLNFYVESGSVISIVGESGIGKTTLLRILSGIHIPISGNVFIDDSEKPIVQPDSSIFIVFQDYNLTLLPWLTVRQNILLGQYKTGNIIDEPELINIIKDLFKEFKNDFPGFLDKYPNKLSGGQRQRLQIARALVSNAQFIMFDEPDSAVDTRTKSLIRESIKKLSKEKHKGVIVITHDIENAIKFSDEIYVMSRKGSNAELFRYEVPAELNKSDYEAKIQSLKEEIINRLYKIEDGIN